MNFMIDGYNEKKSLQSIFKSNIKLYKWAVKLRNMLQADEIGRVGMCPAVTV